MPEAAQFCRQIARSGDASELRPGGDEGTPDSRRNPARRDNRPAGSQTRNMRTLNHIGSGFNPPTTTPIATTAIFRRSSGPSATAGRGRQFSTIDTIATSAQDSPHGSATCKHSDPGQLWRLGRIECCQFSQIRTRRLNSPRGGMPTAHTMDCPDISHYHRDRYCRQLHVYSLD